MRLLEFGKFAEQTTERVEKVALTEAQEGGQPVVYLDSPKTSKEDRCLPQPVVRLVAAK